MVLPLYDGRGRGDPRRRLRRVASGLENCYGGIKPLFKALRRGSKIDRDTRGDEVVIGQQAARPTKLSSGKASDGDIRHSFLSLSGR
jgi:hypothetical protein